MTIKCSACGMDFPSEAAKCKKCGGAMGCDETMCKCGSCGHQQETNNMWCSSCLRKEAEGKS